ncbi:hypothetical protein TAMC210_14160 [Thermanaeromonas sp. C210]|nr:zf-TFIIB domain-containing protein [Thermanaeromonas sp. C210]GFN23099.1 hypothetical protein TAMC210_14160 [Thermanaeromonas sp. C210]
MRCPLCDVTMKEVERRGVLIDVCPECKGIWLDRGELEKLLATVEAPYRDADEWEEEPRWREGYRGGKEMRKGKKRRGLLGEIFDLDFFD